ncbi:helix-turn-helix transcriptional regulator [Roseibium sp. M-1]
MKSSRLLSILLLLQARGQMTAEDLAAEFEVSVRTIHRDIDQLSYSGVPVYAERGRQGGFRLLDGYQTRLTGLDADEAGALLLAGLGPALADLGLTEAADQTTRKVLAALPQPSREKAATVADRFLLDPLAWYRSRQESPLVRQVAAAVWAERKLALTYESWKGEVERVADPLAIVLKAGTWYLVARVETPRVYRIDGIRELKVLDEGFSRPVDFVLKSFWADWIADFEARLNRQQVTLRVSAEGLRRLGEQGFEPAETPAFSGPNRRAEIRVAMEEGAYTVRVLLSLGAEAEVLAPAALRNALLAELQNMQGLYA